MEVNQEEHTVVLSSGEVLSYRYLIGADGANSQIRKLVDSKYKPNALCLEFDYSTYPIEDEIQVFFSVINSGYGWCFPKKDKYAIGIGSDVKNSKIIRTKLQKFCNDIGKGFNEQKISGAMIPFGKFVKKPVSENILLIGDAAGFVDPVTGEGLYLLFFLQNAHLIHSSLR